MGIWNILRIRDFFLLQVARYFENTKPFENAKPFEDTKLFENTKPFENVGSFEVLRMLSIFDNVK